MKKYYSYLVVGSLLLGTLVLTACSKQEIEVSGSYSAFLQGMDWGESSCTLFTQLKILL